MVSAPENGRQHCRPVSNKSPSLDTWNETNDEQKNHHSSIHPDDNAMREPYKVTGCMGRQMSDTPMHGAARHASRNWRTRHASTRRPELVSPLKRKNASRGMRCLSLLWWNKQGVRSAKFIQFCFCFLFTSEISVTVYYLLPVSRESGPEILWIFEGFWWRLMMSSCMCPPQNWK